MRKVFEFTETEAKAYDAMRAAMSALHPVSFRASHCAAYGSGFCDNHEECDECPINKAMEALEAVNAELEKE